MGNYCIRIFGSDHVMFRQRRKMPLNSMAACIFLSQCLSRRRKQDSFNLHADVAFSISWFLTSCTLLLLDGELCVLLPCVLSSCMKYSHIWISFGLRLSDFKLMSTYNIKVSNICIYADLTWPHHSKNSF